MEKRNMNKARRRLRRGGKAGLPALLLAALLLIVPSASARMPDPVPSPVDPDATAQARDTLAYLYQISGKMTIGGQHDYLESPDEFSDKIRRITGKYAGLHSYELGAINNQSAALLGQQRKWVVDSAIAWHNNGGIVSITFHASVPGACPCWSQIEKRMSQAEFDKYVTPGTKQYDKLIAQLDDVAVSLKQLAEAKVPVLWRPYHESNGYWFWWGAKDNFAALWKIMYDRFTGVHKLHNLLWVWSPNAPNGWADAYVRTYPGPEMVDILAVDIYDNDFKQVYYDEIVRLANGKPVAIGESDKLPGDEILRKQPKWVYVSTWGKMITENNTVREIRAFYDRTGTVERRLLALNLRHDADAGLEPDRSGVVPALQELLTKRSGIRAQYFDNKNFTSPVAERIEPNVDYDWREAAPLAAMDPDTFSVRWQGMLVPKYSERYTIGGLTDDGVRIWVDGQLVVESWKKQSWVESAGQIDLQAGKPVSIVMEYYEQQGGALAKLFWSSASQSKQIIPAEALFLP